MRRSSFLHTPFLAASLLTSIASAKNTAAALTLAECRLESAHVAGAVSARCGWFDVAENREAADSKRIRIHVAVVPALSRTAAPDPLVVISGGPGQAASDFYLASRSAFEPVRRTRDIVVIDQRGTGKSNRLDCELPTEWQVASIDAAHIQHATRACLQSLPGDPRFYSTSVAVRDLEDIRAALGYEQWNLYGISYGTRVAQHYVRRYENRVRALVLDGILPVDELLGPNIAPLAQRALDAILKRCTDSTPCQQAFPDVAGQLAALRARLARAPIPLELPDPSTAKPHRLEFGSMHLAMALRLHSYSDDTAALLPFLIHEAANGRPEALAAQALMLARDLDKQLANGLHNAVVCTEDLPFITPEAAADPMIDRTYLGRSFMDTLMAMCAVWPSGVIDPDFHAPLASAVPALLLSGENDPVTPPEFGARALQSFSNAKHVVVPGQGHGQLNNACVMRLLTRFIEHAQADALDLNCVAKQAAAPFMLDALSPGP